MRRISVCLMAALWSVLAHSGLASTRPDVLPARLTEAGAARPIQLDNRQIRLHTAHGSRAFWLQDLRRITCPAQPAGILIETTHGDIWTATWDSGPLAGAEGGAPVSIPVATPTFDQIEIYSPPDGWHAGTSAQVQLDTGETIIVPVWDLILNLPTDAMTWAVPMGSLRQVQRQRATPDEVEWRLVFAGGHVEEMSTASGSGLLKTSDTYGNRLRLPLRQVNRIDIDSPGDEPEVAPDAPAFISALPFTVWSLRGELMDIRLPGPVLARLSPRPPGRVEAETVYGDRFTGTPTPANMGIPPATRLRPSSRSMRLSRKGTAEDTRDLTTLGLEFPAVPRLPLPPGWPVWQLRSGDVFAARFQETTLAIRLTSDNTATNLSTAELASVLQADRTLTVVDQVGNAHQGKPKDGDVSVVLLVNGMSHNVSWKDVVRVTSAYPETRLNVSETEPVTGAMAGDVAAAAPEEANLIDEMVAMRGGSFVMGRTQAEGLPDELPPHAVTLRPFWIDAQEVTREQFTVFVDDTGYKTDAERLRAINNWRDPGFLQGPDEPVVWVSWRDAAQFCNWRSREVGLRPCYKFDRADAVITLLDRDGYRLPTEAEWEFAARGGADILYPWGNADGAEILRTVANFRQPTGSALDEWLWTNPVRAYPPADNGLFGMAGNVWEWCEDWYFDQAYASIHRQKPDDPCVRTGDVTGLTRRVMRGGSFDSPAEMLRCTSRANGLPTASANRVGFRCVRQTATAP